MFSDIFKVGSLGVSRTVDVDDNRREKSPLDTDMHSAHLFNSVLIFELLLLHIFAISIHSCSNIHLTDTNRNIFSLACCGGEPAHMTPVRLLESSQLFPGSSPSLRNYYRFVHYLLVRFNPHPHIPPTLHPRRRK